MASSLNAEARDFVPSQNTIAYPPYQNPIMVSYYQFPIYGMPFEITSSHCAPPPPHPYQYFSFHASFQVLQPFVPTAPASVPRIRTIGEPEENPGRDNAGNGYDTAAAEAAADALVINRQRVVEPRAGQGLVRPWRYRGWRRVPGARVLHQNFEISSDADFAVIGKTTLMIKNIPVKFSKGRLVDILRKHCIEQNRQASASAGDESVLSAFDFFYLPMDFRSGLNKGYAFVNFTSPLGARRLHKDLQGHSWISAGSNKVCQVNFASIQGLSKLIERNHMIRFPSSVPDDFMPVHFEPPCNGLNESVEHLIGQRIS